MIPGTLVAATFCDVFAGICVGSITILWAAWFCTPIVVHSDMAYTLTIIILSQVAKHVICYSVFAASTLGFLAGIIYAVIKTVCLVESSPLNYNATIITGLLFAGNRSMPLAVFLANLAVDPWLKVIEYLGAFWIYQFLPQGLRYIYLKPAVPHNAPSMQKQEPAMR